MGQARAEDGDKASTTDHGSRGVGAATPRVRPGSLWAQPVRSGAGGDRRRRRGIGRCARRAGSPTARTSRRWWRSTTGAAT